MKYIGCKHLDYESKYDCDLIETPEGWKYWYRRVVPWASAPRNVQFCKLRGRINDIFSCINPDEQACFRSQDE